VNLTTVTVLLNRQGASVTLSLRTCHIVTGLFINSAGADLSRVPDYKPDRGPSHPITLRINPIGQKNTPISRQTMNAAVIQLHAVTYTGTCCLKTVARILEHRSSRIYPHRWSRSQTCSWHDILDNTHTPLIIENTSNSYFKKSKNVAKILNKSSAVAEMGDRLTTIDMGRKLGRGCCGGAGSPLGHHLTQCGLGQGLPLYQVASWSIQPFGHNYRNATLLHVGICLWTIFIRSLVVTRQNIYSTRALSYCSIPNKIK